MLSEKGALISEDRVKNLTDAQWLFHYAEIQHKRRNTVKEESNIIGIILDRIESMLCDNAIFSRTDLKFEKIKETISKIADRHEQNRTKRTGKSKPSDSVKDSMLSEFNEVKNIAPVELNVEEVDEGMAGVPRIKAPKKGRKRSGRR